MKKSILSIGKALNKVEQKQVSGGNLTRPGGQCDAIEGYVPVGCPCNAGWCLTGLYCDASQSSHLEGRCDYL
jgi:hypothetical protein